MRVCARKNLTIDDKRIVKHEEGTLIAVTRDTRNGATDDYFYLVEFKEHGRLLVNKNDLDILNIP